MINKLSKNINKNWPTNESAINIRVFFKLNLKPILFPLRFLFHNRKLTNQKHCVYILKKEQYYPQVCHQVCSRSYYLYGALFFNSSIVIIKNYYSHNNSGDTVSHDWILKTREEWMDVPPMIFTGNPLIIKPGMVFFMHMILMDSEAQLAMNLGETYLVTETGNERLGKQKLDLVVL